MVSSDGNAYMDIYEEHGRSSHEGYWQREPRLAS